MVDTLLYQKEKFRHCFNFTIDKNINIYPNPTKDYFVVNSPENIRNVSIFNSTGKKLKSYFVTQDRINISDLSTGMYFIKVETESGSQITKKLIIQ